MMLRYKLSRQNGNAKNVSSRSMRSYMRSIDADSISAIANVDEEEDDEEEDNDDGDDDGDGILTPAPTENENDDDEEIAFYASNKQTMKSINVPSSSQKFKNKSYATKKKGESKSNGKGNGNVTSNNKNLNDVNAYANLNEMNTKKKKKKKKKNGVPSTIIIDGGDHDDVNNNIENYSIIVPLSKSMSNNNPVVVVVPPHVPIIEDSSSSSNNVAATPINNNKYSSVFPRSGTTPASVVQVLGSISSSSSLFPLPLPPTTVSPETNILGGGGVSTTTTTSTPLPKSPPKRVSLDHNLHELPTSNNDGGGGGGGGGYLCNNNNSNNNNNNNSSMATSGMSSTMGSMMNNSSFIANGVANSIYGTSVMDNNNNIINCTSSNSIRDSLGYHYGFVDYSNQGQGRNNYNPGHNHNSVQQHQQQVQQQVQQQQQQRYGNGFGAVVPSTPAPPSTPVAASGTPAITNSTPPPPMLPLVAQTSQRTFTAASTLVSIMSTSMMALGANIITNKRARADPMLYELSKSKSKSNTKSIITNTTSSSKKKKHKMIHNRHEFSNNNIFDHARLSLTHDFSTTANDADTTAENGEEEDVFDFGVSSSSMNDDDDCSPYGSSNNSIVDAAPLPKKRKNKKTMIQQDDTDEDDDVDNDAVVATTTTTNNNQPFKRIPRRFVDDPSLPTIKGGMRLAVSNDKQHLNSLHCFVRSELLEVFVLDDLENDDEEDAPNNNQYRNRVGLRCVHCGRKSKKDRHGTSMSTFFPKSIEDIYRGVCTWQRIHFKDCHHMPEHFKEKYDYLKEIDRTRGKKVHWVKSAREMGFRNADEDRNGVIYDPDGEVAAAAAADTEGSMLLEALTSVDSEATVESELLAASAELKVTAGVTTMSSSLAEYQSWSC